MSVKIMKFISLGIPSNLAKRLVSRSVTSTFLKSNNLSDIEKKAGVNRVEARLIKKCASRAPIREDILFSLLDASLYTCSVCKGIKSSAYIVHHINEYQTSRDNSYDNLIVLCPNDHDLSHRDGTLLTHKLSKGDLKKIKAAWEKEVASYKKKVIQKQSIIDSPMIDFVNVNRLNELLLDKFGELPETEFSPRLKRAKILKQDGSLNIQHVKKLSGSPHMLFDYPNHGEPNHFARQFSMLQGQWYFENLEGLLKVSKIKGQDLQGRAVFLNIGMYGKTENGNRLITLFYFKSKILVKAIVDIQYIQSNSALGRMKQKSTYLIFGHIRSVEKSVGKYQYIIDIRPIIVFMPVSSINRTPKIRFIKDLEYV